jgi:hypothetical protein
MDRLGLITLRAEIDEDVRHACLAAAAARQRFGQGAPAGGESCAFQLVRFFNIVEQMGLRVAKAFENHIDDDSGWHAELIRRLSIVVPGVRPRFYPDDVLPALRDLRGFRHVVAHAYDLELDHERLAIVLRHAEECSARLPEIVAHFIETVAAEQGW